MPPSGAKAERALKMMLEDNDPGVMPRGGLLPGAHRVGVSTDKNGIGTLKPYRKPKAGPYGR